MPARILPLIEFGWHNGDMMTVVRTETGEAVSMDSVLRLVGVLTAEPEVVAGDPEGAKLDSVTAFGAHERYWIFSRGGAYERPQATVGCMDGGWKSNEGGVVLHIRTNCACSSNAVAADDSRQSRQVEQAIPAKFSVRVDGAMGAWCLRWLRTGAVVLVHARVRPVWPLAGGTCVVRLVAEHVRLVSGGRLPYGTCMPSGCSGGGMPYDLLVNGGCGLAHTH